MSSENREVVARISTMTKLLYMQIRPQIEERKRKLKLTQKQLRVYDACDSESTIEQIADRADCSVRYVEGLLPAWEKLGLILSIGKGRSKRYTNIENLEV